MAADVLEFTIDPAHHHRLELLREVLVADMTTAHALARQAQEAEQRAKAKLTRGLARLLEEAHGTHLPEGKVPAGSSIHAEFEKRTITLTLKTRKQDEHATHAHQAETAGT